MRLIISISLILVLFSCENLKSAKTKATQSDIKLSQPNLPITQPTVKPNEPDATIAQPIIDASHPNRAIKNPIPVDLHQQKYPDQQKVEKHYDHKKQLEQLILLEKEGKKINLLIGRGNGEINKEPLPTDNNNIVWVFGNKYSSYPPGSLVANETLHLFNGF